MEANPTSIIVVGAGMAGIKIARELTLNGWKVVLLEGSNEIGGRIKNHDFCGQVVECGANWITGTVNEDDGKVNPVY